MEHIDDKTDTPEQSREISFGQAALRDYENIYGKYSDIELTNPYTNINQVGGPDSLPGC